MIHVVGNIFRLLNQLRCESFSKKDFFNELSIISNNFISVSPTEYGCSITGRSYRSMQKNEKPHDIRVSFIFIGMCSA